MSPRLTRGRIKRRTIRGINWRDRWRTFNKRFSTKITNGVQQEIRKSAKRNTKKAKCKNTDIFYNNMGSIPFHSYLTKREIIYLAKSLIKSVKDLIE